MAEEAEMGLQGKLMAGLVLCVAAGVATAANAQGVVTGKTVTVKGCVQWLPPGCKKLGGYVLNEAVPYVPVESYVVVTGKVTNYSGACFAPRLTDIRWKATKGSCLR
jgi:hypothetical protein